MSKEMSGVWCVAHNLRRKDGYGFLPETCPAHVVLVIAWALLQSQCWASVESPPALLVDGWGLGRFLLSKRHSDLWCPVLSMTGFDCHRCTGQWALTCSPPCQRGVYVRLDVGSRLGDLG